MFGPVDPSFYNKLGERQILKTVQYCCYTYNMLIVFCSNLFSPDES